ncbi:MAG TPA: hypothetical protein VHT03_06260 [Rhizomicrobium sp.]|nr:hypothetical protein [Rhizomicrobium sp.]
MVLIYAVAVVGGARIPGGATVARVATVASGKQFADDALKKLARDGMESPIRATDEIIIADEKTRIIAAIRERTASHVH